MTNKKTELTFPELVINSTSIYCIKKQSMDYYVCNLAEGIKTFNIDRQITNISKQAFLDDSTIERVIFPKDNNSSEPFTIEESAFENCSNLQIFQCENDLITDKQSDESKNDSKLQKFVIQHNAFKNCSKLHTVILSAVADGITIEKDAFFGCTELRTIVILSKKSNINEQAFSHSDKLVFVTIEGSDAERYARELGFRYVNVNQCK